MFKFVCKNCNNDIENVNEINMYEVSNDIFDFDFSECYCNVCDIDNDNVFEVIVINVN